MCSNFFLCFISIHEPGFSFAIKKNTDILMCRVKRGTGDATSPLASHFEQDPAQPVSRLDRLSFSSAEVASPETRAVRGGDACLCSH